MKKFFFLNKHNEALVGVLLQIKWCRWQAMVTCVQNLVCIELKEVF